MPDFCFSEFSYYSKHPWIWKAIYGAEWVRKSPKTCLRNIWMVSNIDSSSQDLGILNDFGADAFSNNNLSTSYRWEKKLDLKSIGQATNEPSYRHSKSHTSSSKPENRLFFYCLLCFIIKQLFNIGWKEKWKTPI